MTRFLLGIVVGIILTLLFFEIYPGGIDEASNDLNRAIAAHAP